MSVVKVLFPMPLPNVEQTVCVRCLQPVLTDEAVSVTTPDGKWGGMAHPWKCDE